MNIFIEGSQMFDLRIFEHLRDGLYRSEWNVGALKLRHPMETVFTCEDLR